MIGKSRDFFQALQLHHCRGWTSPADLFSGLRLIVDKSGLIPLENRMVRIDERRYARPVVKDMRGWFLNNYRTRREWDENTYSRFRAKDRLAVSFRVPLFADWQSDAPLAEALEIGLDAAGFGTVYDCISFLCMVPGKRQSIRGVSVAEIGGRLFGIYEQFALPLVEHLRPEYAVLTDRNWATPYGEAVVLRNVEYIFWWNFFGPDYLDKYGETIFLKAPGWRKEKIADGILYQVTKSWHEAKDPSLQERIRDYFGRSGIDVLL